MNSAIIPETMLTEGHWRYLKSQLHLAEKAHNTGDFSTELVVLQNLLHYMAMVFGVMQAGGKHEPVPPHEGLLQLLAAMRQAGDDKVSTWQIEPILVNYVAGIMDRWVILLAAGRYGIMTAFFGDFATALPWVHLANDHIPTFEKQVTGLGSKILDDYGDMWDRVRFDVVSCLSLCYRDIGEQDMADWHAFVRDTEGVPMVKQITEFQYGLFMDAFQALDTAFDMQRQHRRIQAVTLIENKIKLLVERRAPDWLKALFTAKLDELKASSAGDMLAAREAVSQQLAWLKNGIFVASPATIAGMSVAALQYAKETKREDLVFGDAAMAMLFANTSKTGPRAAEWLAYMYLAQWADVMGRRWTSCLFLKLAITRRYATREKAHMIMSDIDVYADEEDGQYLQDYLAEVLTSLGRLAEATEAVEFNLARGSRQSPLSWTDAESEAAARIQSAVDNAAGEIQDREKGLATILADASRSVDASGQARDEAILRLNDSIRARATDALPAGAFADTALLHYVVDRSSALILVSIEGQQTSVRLDLGGAAEVNALAFGILRTVRDPSRDSTPELRRGYEALLAPIASCLERVSRLLIAAPGTLHAIPWGALHDGQRFAAERWTCVRAAAPGIDLRQPPVTAIQIASCAMTMSGSGFPALGDVAAREAAAAAEDTPGGVLVDGVFTRLALEQALRSATVLHVASHFEPDPLRLDRSRLLLGDGTTVSLNDLVAIGLAKLDLIVLSACSTGVIDSAAAAESAFAGDAILLDGGARAAVCTLWPADNEATYSLMMSFYRNLRGGFDKDAALARAQRALIAGDIGGGQWRLPFFWAAPVLSGNWLGWR